ncbi:MAG: hypothetical protein KAT83_00015 [Candidatus Aenigmarchaeota archaeon]|nr:hypothetical protein [Candidatus Aenigmarchaeota archaeon]
MESRVGGIVNKFKLKRRRVTLFFEDILANYIKQCEEAGYEKDMKKIGEKWCLLGTSELTPRPVMMLPSSLFFKLMKKVWTNVGIIEDMDFNKKDDVVMLQVKGNTITRTIGKNNFAVGCFSGILTIVLRSGVKSVRVNQDKKSEKYIFKLGKQKKSALLCKKKEKYDKLNSMQKLSGFTLEDGLRRKIFQLQGNRLFFRGTPICNSENTLFHLFGNEKIMFNILPQISYNYFKEIVHSNRSTDEKLVLLKTLLQIMGWGMINIVKSRSEINMEIKKPPYGLQNENDNWDFLVQVILGYLWLIDKNITIKSVREKAKTLKITYGF